MVNRRLEEQDAKPERKILTNLDNREMLIPVDDHLPYPLPSNVGALEYPLLATDQISLYKFKWGQCYWVQSHPKSQFFIWTAKSNFPHQQRYVTAFRTLLGGSARHIIDVGTNIGMVAAQYSTFSKLVTGFEPTPKIIEMAAKNIVINNASFNTKLYNIALSDYKGTGVLTDLRNNSGANYLSSSLKQRKGSTVRLKVTVDQLDNFDFDDVDGIKIDVEGSELAVLLGAERTITKCRPIIQIELITATLKKHKLHPQDVYNWFKDKEYIVMNYKLERLSLNNWVYIKSQSDRFFAPAEYRQLSLF